MLLLLCDLHGPSGIIFITQLGQYTGKAHIWGTFSMSLRETDSKSCRRAVDKLVN